MQKSIYDLFTVYNNHKNICKCKQLESGNGYITNLEFIAKHT